MESHPLNLAHAQHRRAEAHMLKNRYDEAIQCHQNAAELLLDAMKYTNSAVALESLTLQHSYHLKQKDLIKIKKEQYSRVKDAIEDLRHLGSNLLYNPLSNENSRLQVAIYRGFCDIDALFHKLNHSIPKSTEQKSTKEPVREGEVTDGKKSEKTQALFEELQLLFQDVHSLVEQLFVQVEILKDDNKTYRGKVAFLESERSKFFNIPTTCSSPNPKDSSIVTKNDDEIPKASATTDIDTTNVAVASGNSPTKNPDHRIDETQLFDLSALKDNLTK